MNRMQKYLHLRESIRSTSASLDELRQCLRQCGVPYEDKDGDIIIRSQVDDSYLIFRFREDGYLEEIR